MRSVSLFATKCAVTPALATEAAPMAAAMIIELDTTNLRSLISAVV